MTLVSDTKRYIFRLEFNGAPFCGWQLQSEGPQYTGKPSIQSQLERAVAILLGRSGERFPVMGCARTDSGVHAREFFCQVIHASDCAINVSGRRENVSGFKEQNVAGRRVTGRL